MSSFSLAQHGITPLITAAANGHVAVAEMLIAAGADVNLKSTISWSTPLHRAAEWGQLEVVQLLLRHGADKKLKNDDGRKPVDVVCGYRQHKAAITALLR